MIFEDIEDINRIDPNEDIDDVSIHSRNYSFNENNIDPNVGDENIDVNSTTNILSTSNEDNDNESNQDYEKEITTLADEVAVLKEPYSRPKWSNAGAGINSLKLAFGNKKYASVNHKLLTMHIAMHVMMKQMSAKEGIKRYGEVGLAAMVK